MYTLDDARGRVVDFDATSLGAADLDLFARYNLYRGPVVITPEVRLKVPLGYAPPSGTFEDLNTSFATSDDVALGDGQVDLTTSMLFGTYLPWTRTFARADVGFNARFGGPGHQLLANAKVGQFAVYEMKQMGGKKMRFEVTKVEDRTVTYKITRPGGGSSEDTVDLAEKDEKYQVPTELLGVLKDKIEDKKMKVGEAEISVKVIKRELKGGGSTENWITADVPPFMEALSGSATAQSSKDGAVHFVLVEFGGGK